jgi:hypothetical protein
MVDRPDRVANVRGIAARIAKTAEGLSIREFLDASALAAGKLMVAMYKGPGLQAAVDRYTEALRRSLKGD